METLLIVGLSASIPVLLMLFRYGPYLFVREPRFSPEETAEFWRGVHDAYVQGLRAGMKRD
ncbi:hypothetical protein [Nonomuraea wenchangensis]|uniref:hypothetical protein n=1 Tax=Nonomuraea wenchangensis TaxID=568860 RepID=UPI0033347F9C